MDMLCISAEGCLSTNLTLSLVPHQWDLEHKGNSSGLTSAFLGKCKMGDDYKLLCFHCSSIQCSVWKTNCTHWNVWLGAGGGMGKVHPSRLKLPAALRCRCWQLEPAVIQVDSPGSYPVLQPVAGVQLRSITSENPVSKKQEWILEVL